MFIRDKFVSHSGLNLDWKIECDHLTDEDLEVLAELVGKRIKFRIVVGIPSGGIRFADKLIPYSTNRLDDPILVVDDVLTTGKSMNEYKEKYYSDYDTIGVVIFCRGENCPHWICPIFTYHPWFWEVDNV